MVMRYENIFETASSSSSLLLPSLRPSLSSSAILRLPYFDAFSRFSEERTAAGETNSANDVKHEFQKVHSSSETSNGPGFEYTVAPPKAPSNIRIGVMTKRGPISTRVVCGGPFGCNGSFSIIWKQL